MGFFKDSLKKWFYTNSSQAASTSARIPLLDASGNPIGSDTMANLASVLGVAKRTLTANDNANNMVEPGVYGVSNGVRPQNSPLIYNGVIVVCRNTFSKVVQVAFDYNYSKCFFRVIDVSSSPTYKDWVEITTDFPSFYKSYNSLSSLASALGGLFLNVGTYGEYLDMNNLPDKYICIYPSGVNALNTPNGDKKVYIVLCIGWQGNRRYQIAFNCSDKKIYSRLYTGEWDAWTEW